jgi:integrase
MSRIFKRDDFWWIDFQDASGVRHRKKIAPQKRIAQEALDAILGNVARRQHLGVIDDSPISFADFADEWQKRVWHTLRERTQERFGEIVRLHLKPAFPGSLRSITAASVEKYIAARVEAGAGASTVNRERTVLMHMLRRAVTWQYLSRNPMVDSQGSPLVRPLKEPAGRTRWLAAEEIERLLNACEQARGGAILRAFIIVALNTGMRRNEIRGLTRQTVDFTNSIATLAETKNGQARAVYLNQAAIDVLKALPVRFDGKFFPFGPNQVSIMFARAVRRAGLEDCRLHDLRHTFASYHAMNGAQGRVLQSLLGHKDGRMTARYSHLSEGFLRETVARVELGAQKRA